jgi:hypothetical protein
MIYLYIYLGVAGLLTIGGWNWLYYAEKNEAENPLVSLILGSCLYLYDSTDYVVTFMFALLWPLLIVFYGLRYLLTLPARVALRFRR